MLPPTSLPTLLTKITTPYTPHRLATLNDHSLLLARIDGPFIFHAHEDSDELFYLLEGKLRLEIEGGGGDEDEAKSGEEGEEGKEEGKEGKGKDVKVVELQVGDVFVVPRGVRHRPVGEGAVVMMVERVGTVNTGGEGGERTVGVREGRRGV